MKSPSAIVDDLAELARLCIEEANYDTYFASKLFQDKINEAPDLKRILLEPFFEDACKMRIHAVYGAKRQAIMADMSRRAEGVADRPDQGKRRIHLLAESYSLMDWPVIGTPLSKCTKAQILEGARRYMEQGTDMARKGKRLKRRQR